jgi:simple sugar transport system ATP-binding protein
MAISDRIAVLYAGQFVAMLDTRTTTIEQIGLLMTGSQTPPDPNP